MNNSSNDLAFKEERAKKSLGISNQSILNMVRRLIVERSKNTRSGKLLDVGCGVGNLHSVVHDLVNDYEGLDVVYYDEFPSEAFFHKIDLDSGQADLPQAYADFVVAVETIEHLENPRAFMRELFRLCKPNGWVVVTTPNQLSLLSKLTFLVKNQFNAFQDSCYPAHITALLEVDLRRIGREIGFQDIAISFSSDGRLPGFSKHWPNVISQLFPRALSDNIAFVGKRP